MCRCPRARPCATGLPRPGTRSCGCEIERDGGWRHDGEPLSVAPGRRAARRGRRVPGAARPVRRGRHGAGAARDARRGVCRRRRGGVGGVHGQGAVQGADGGERALPRSSYVGVREQRWRPSAREQVLDEIAALGLPVFVKPAHLGSSVGHRQGHRALASCTERSEQAFAHDALVIVEAMAQRGRGRVRRARQLARGAYGAAAALASSRGRSSFDGRLVRLRGEVHAGRHGAEGARAHLRHARRERVRELARRGVRARRLRRARAGGLLRRRRARCW